MTTIVHCEARGMVARRAVLVLVAALAQPGCATSWDPPRLAPPPVLPELPPEQQVTLSGVLHDYKTGRPIRGALVIAQCDCLAGPYEVLTNAEGRYVYRGLPAGKYTVQVLRDQVNVSRMMDIPAGAKVRMNYQVDLKWHRRGDHFGPWHEMKHEKSLLQDHCTTRPGQTPECRREPGGRVHATSVR